VERIGKRHGSQRNEPQAGTPIGERLGYRDSRFLLRFHELRSITKKPGSFEPGYK